MYDLIVIGGGPGGGEGAEAARHAGMSVLLIEEKHLGGVCLNEGCIPSKTLLYSAKLYKHAKESEAYGVISQNVSFDLKKAMERKESIISKLRKGSEFSKKKAGVEVIMGRATILPKKDNAFVVSANNTEYTSKNLLVCTGSQAFKPPIPGADQPWVLTNREILSLDTIPKNLVIIGGGVIGIEFATFFSAIGSNVTIVEMLPSIATMLDNDIRTMLRKELEKSGITIRTSCAVTAIGDHSVTFTDTTTNTSETLPADNALLSVGRRPVTSGLGLENLGVTIERGAIKTDECGRTNVPNLYAAGDVNGVSMLAHTASRESAVVIDTIMGKKNRVNYDTIPGVIYGFPEVAWVGMTQAEAQKRGIEVAVNTIPLTFSGRYMAETQMGRGVFKVVVDKKYKTVLGVHMIGHECSEMIQSAVIMIENELRIADVRDMVFPHPTVSEVLKDALVGVKF